MKHIIPRASIIVSIYNGENFLHEFLQNVLQQTILNDIEVLLLDAQSTDSSKFIIDQYKHPSIKYTLLDKRYSIYETWNIGIDLSQSEILSNWNIDDRRKFNSIETQTVFMEDNLSYDVCYGSVAWSHKPNEKFEENSLIDIYPCHDVNIETMMLNNSPHCMPFWRKDLHRKFGYFDTQYKTAADFDFWMRCLHGKAKFSKLHEIVGSYYYNPNGLSTHAQSTNTQEGEIIKQKYKNIKKCMRDINITVIQHSDEKYLPVLNCVKDNNLEYCQKHNFKYDTPIGDCVPKDVTEKNRVYWNKFFYLKSLLEKDDDYENWYFLLDCDATFTDHNIDLRIFPYLSPPDRDFIACNVYVNDMSWISWNINAGILFIKNSPYMRRWLTQILDICKQTNGAHIDQPVIQQMLRENYMGLADKTSFFPSTAFNSEEGNFIYHACGPTTCHFENAIEQKVKILGEKINNIKK